MKRLNAAITCTHNGGLMEYEFRLDPITGQARAQFSYEQEMIGPWLEVEVGNNTEMLSALLLAVSNIEAGQDQEITVTGKEYSVTLSNHDAHIQPNISMNGCSEVPEELQSDDLFFDENVISSCGLDDFRQILLSWAKFTS